MKPAIVFIIFCNLFLSSHTISSSPHLLKEIWGLSAEKPLLHPDLEIVRDRIIKDLLAGPLDDAEVKRITQSLQNGGSWPGIDYEDVSRTGFEHSGHLSNMLVLARAYKRSEEHTSELQSRENLVCRLLLEKKKNKLRF